MVFFFAFCFFSSIINHAAAAPLKSEMKKKSGDLRRSRITGAFKNCFGRRWRAGKKKTRRARDSPSAPRHTRANSFDFVRSGGAGDAGDARAVAAPPRREVGHRSIQLFVKVFFLARRTPLGLVAKVECSRGCTSLWLRLEKKSDKVASRGIETL